MRDVNALRATPETLFVTGDARIAPSAAREAHEFRDIVQALSCAREDRTIFKLGFVWHEQQADIFCETVKESLSRLGLDGQNLANDIQGRARSFVKALGTSYLSIDLLCSRFKEGASPVHVDYPEFLRAQGNSPRSPFEDSRAFAYVMPYVGAGTEYLKHPRALVENTLRREISAQGTSKEGINHIVNGALQTDAQDWSSVPQKGYSIHRNGLAIHRSPSSEDFRVVLAMDACMTNEALERPLQAIREKILRNQRAVFALKNGGWGAAR